MRRGPPPPIIEDSNPPGPSASVKADFAFDIAQTPKAFYGVYQAHDAQLDLVLPPVPWTGRDRFLFAPTLLPAGGTCMEVTTIHQRLKGTAQQTTHWQGWYDWCGSGQSGAWAVIEPMNSAFQAKYVRTFAGEPTLVVVVVTPNTGNLFGQCWYGHLYNYQVGGYEQKYSSCGGGVSYSPAGVDGWTGWESYDVVSQSSCPTLPSIRALSIQVADPDDGQFHAVTDYQPFGPIFAASAIINGPCWRSNPQYTMSWNPAGLPAASWRASTPSP